MVLKGISIGDTRCQTSVKKVPNSKTCPIPGNPDPQGKIFEQS
jgi:hypothetical protein